MKLITIILLFTLTSMTFSQDWVKYTTSIDLNKEPIQEEWVTPCVTGYENCNYADKSYQWCTNTYNFKVWGGKVIEQQGKPGYIASYKVPKGYTVTRAGGFDPNQYKTTSEFPQLRSEQKLNISGTADENCVVYPSYYLVQLIVTESSYVKITREMPAFLKLLISAQNALYNSGIIQVKAKQCQTDKQAAIDSNVTLIAEINNLNNQRNTYRVAIEILQNKIETYQHILSGVKQDQWINKQKNDEELKKLQNEIAKLEEQIKALKAKNTDLSKEITTFTNEKTKLDQQRVQLNAELTKQKNSSHAEIEVLRKIDEEKTKEVQAYAKLSEKQTNDLGKEIRLKELIVKYREELGEIQKNIKKNKMNLDKSKQILTVLVKKSDDQDKKVRKINDNIKVTEVEVVKVATNVEKATEAINSKNKSVIENDLAITKLNEDMNKFKIKVEDVKAKAKQETESFYKKEIQTALTEIKIVTQSLESANNSVNTKSQQVTKNDATVVEKDSCFNTNSQQAQSWMNNYNPSKSQLIAKRNQIEKLCDQSISLLDNVISLVNNSTPVQNWLSGAKLELHKYLDAISGTTIDLVAFRRRKLLKRRRKLLKRRRYI